MNAPAAIPGKQKLGIIPTTIPGTVGAMMAGCLRAASGLYQAGQGAGWIGSAIGAVIVLFAYGLIKQS